MELTSHTRGAVTVIAVTGRIDQSSADPFRVALEPHLLACDREGAALVLDLSGVEYISSVGLRALMLAARQVTAQGGRIAVAGLQALVKEIFEISRFHLVFKVFDSTDAAVEALA